MRLLMVPSNRKRSWIATAAPALVASLLLIGPVLAQRGRARPPKAKVSLVSSVKAVVPGQPFDVAIVFKIDQGWHIYWQNPGDVGIAPSAAWKLPNGFSAGPLRFPVPQSHPEGAGLISFILEDQPILQSTINTPNDLTDRAVKLAADLKYLICEKTCIREQATISLELPVAPRGSQPEPANEALFKRMRHAQPHLKSKFVAITPSVSATPLVPDTKFDLVLNIEVSRGYHIQSNTPLDDALIKSEVFVHRVAGIDIEHPLFPKAKLRHDAIFGNISEYAGHFQVRIPGEVYDPLDSNPIKLGGLFRFQCCTDKGNCFPPETIVFSTTAATNGPHRDKPLAASTGPAGGENAVASVTDEDTMSAPSLSTEARGATLGGRSLWYWLGLAFLGGLILNIMPCVLPVISIKVLSFVQQASEDAWRVRRLGLTFCAGIVVSFWALAAIIMVLKSWGSHLGWGFQFQSPTFVIAMIAVMFVFGLSLLGVFTISLPGKTTSNLANAEAREGYTGAFLKGVLGTILATPCTAPFLGPALGVAFASSNIELFWIFTAVGLGMASPFFLLTMYPAWLKYLPRPGVWMEHFKQLMGFLLMGTVVWLLWIVGQQIGVDGMATTMVLLIALALACWLIGRQTLATSSGRRVLGWLTGLALVTGTWWFCFERTQTIDDLVAQVRAARLGDSAADVTHIAATDWDKKIPWQRWRKGLPEELANRGYTVYVDYTATWCATCIANKKATLEQKAVRNKMRQNCVIPIEADFTLQDNDILTDLNKFNRSGVPLNIIYAAGNHTPPIVMPTQLVGRTALVLEKLDAAGPSQTCTANRVDPLSLPSGKPTRRTAATPSMQ